MVIVGAAHLLCLQPEGIPQGLEHLDHLFSDLGSRGLVNGVAIILVDDHYEAIH